MIAVYEEIGLSETERSHIDRLEMAKGCWQEGRYEDALIIVDTVIEDYPTPRILLRAWTQRANFECEQGMFKEAMDSLERAAPHLDSGSLYAQGTFFGTRGWVSKNLDAIDAALTDYAGAEAAMEAVGHSEYVANVQKNTAGLYLKIGEIEKAHAQIEKAIVGYSKIGSATLCQAYDTQAAIFLYEGKLGAALDAIHTAIENVNGHEVWLAQFVKLKEQIEQKALEVLEVETIEDLERVKIGMVRRALIQSKGSVTRAGKILGLDHRAVNRIVERYEADLGSYRGKRHERRFQKALIKK